MFSRLTRQRVPIRIQRPLQCDKVATLKQIAAETGGSHLPSFSSPLIQFFFRFV